MKLEDHPEVFALLLSAFGILSAVSYSAHMNTLFINIKIKLIPICKQLHIRIRIDRKLERVCIVFSYNRFAFSFIFSRVGLV